MHLIADLSSPLTHIHTYMYIMHHVPLLVDREDGLSRGKLQIRQESDRKSECRKEWELKGET